MALFVICLFKYQNNFSSNKRENDPSSIWCFDSNSQPPGHEYLHITH